MKKPISQQYTQLTLNFEYEASTTAPAKPSYHFSQAEFDEWQAIDHDIMYGRGAYLYKAVERDLAFQRESATILKQFEAMCASIY